jgi:hypothetical protein
LAVLGQSEGLDRPSVVLPLYAGLFISCCFSTKLPISGLSIAIKYLNNPKSKPEAQPKVPVAFQIVFHVTKVEAKKRRK